VTSRRSVRALLAGLLGVAAALLVSCGSSNGKLIPVAAAGPLQSDFEAVAQEAESADGSCAATEAAIVKTEQDFSALPAAVDAGLRNTLRQGIDNLREHALALCAQSPAQTTTTSTAQKDTTSARTTTTTATTPTVTQTTTTASTPTTTTPPPTTPGTGGGTPAPGAGESPSGAGESGAGGAGPGAGGAGAQEGGK
jgi:type IV secretory pathway VirJ component